MSLDKQTLDGLRIDRSAAPPPRNRGVLIVLGLLVIGAAVAGVAWFNRPEIAAVRIATAQEIRSGDGRTLLNASGYATARRQATISSKVTGRVMEVLVEEGMAVDAGQVLARIDSSNVLASLKLAQAQLEASRKEMGETSANLAQAEREWKRIGQLAALDYASKSDLDRAEALMKSLNARLDRQQAGVTVAEKQVATWEQDLDDTIIRAPFAGIVISKDSQPGEVISPVSAGGGFTRTGICTIVDMNSLEIDVDVNESYINRVKPGQPVEATLDAYPDLHLPAKVIAIVPTADRQKATVKVRVGLEKLDPHILPDMSVKVAFREAENSPTPSVREITVPKAAVQEMDGKSVVWVARDGRAERRAVTVKSVGADTASIAAGLNAGEKVILDAPKNLTDGAAVAEAKP